MHFKQPMIIALSLVASIVCLSSVRAAGLGQRCGGYFGISCDGALWCDPRPGGCEQSERVGTCVNPLECKPKSSPVCGCDGRNYPDDCNRVFRRLAKDHDGECQSTQWDPWGGDR